MDYHGSELKVELKAGDEPVTAADRAASDLIVAGLRDAFPDDVIISEETADDLARLTAKRVWYIDPIDGTRDFIRGEDGFCVMVGLAIDHKPTAGVICAPVGARVFRASPDTGAWLSIPGKPDIQLSVSNVTALKDAKLVASKSHRSTTIDRVKAVLGINNEHNLGSIGLKLGVIAMGERDLYVNPSSKCSVWDTCAPCAILEAAGGKLTNLWGEPLRYDQQDVGHRLGMIASNGHIHDDAVERLSGLFPRQAPLNE